MKSIACLLAVVLIATSAAFGAPRTSARKTRGDRQDQEKSYTLTDIMKSPKEFVEREVVFYCRYAVNANLFKPISTRFNENHHINFAVWPDKTVLWEGEARKQVLPTLYIQKNSEELMEDLRGVRRYELLAITGTVLNVYAGYPWILVTKIERVEKPSERLSKIVIEHMQSGYDALRSNAGGVAARHFEQAIQFGLPAEYRAKAYEQLARAYLLDNKLDRARGYLRQAAQVDRQDPILHLALADVTLRMGDAGEAIAHATFALERSGRHPQAYGIKGEALSLLGDYGKAFADLNTAAGTPGITPREKAMVNIRRARIYTRTDRYPDAARVYAAASEPGEPLAGEAWLHNEIGLFYERLYLESDDARYLESAYAAFDEASKISSLDPAILFNMTEVEFRRQRLAEKPDFAKVAELIERIYQIEPDYAAARILEGRLLYQQEKYEEAEFRYQSVSSQIGNDTMSLLALAEAYIDLGRGDEAAEAAARARSLEPWNHRVQALGQLIEENATALASAPAEPREVMGQDGTAYLIVTGPDGTEYLVPKDAGEQTQEEAVTVETDDMETEVAAPPEEPADVETVPEVVVPAPVQAAPQKDGTTQLKKTVVRKTGIKRQHLAAAEADRLPQEIQASVNPAGVKGRGRTRFPMTEVRLPAGRMPAPDTSRDSVEQEEARQEIDDGALDLGFTPGSPDKLQEVADPDWAEAAEADVDAYDDFGSDYEWEGTAGGDDGEFPGYSRIQGVTAAYASLPLPGAEVEQPYAGGNAVIPPAFTFAPDDSPVIVAAVNNNVRRERVTPARNVNLYNAYPYGRQRAEIIEREPVNRRRGPGGTPAMVPPADGAVRRTQVRLPSSPRGMGM